MSLLSALLDSKLEDAKLITHMQSSTISCTSCALTRTLIWGVEVGAGKGAGMGHCYSHESYFTCHLAQPTS